MRTSEGKQNITVQYSVGKLEILHYITRAFIGYDSWDGMHKLDLNNLVEPAPTKSHTTHAKGLAPTARSTGQKRKIDSRSGNGNTEHEREFLASPELVNEKKKGVFFPLFQSRISIGCFEWAEKTDWTTCEPISHGHGHGRGHSQADPILQQGYE